MFIQTTILKKKHEPILTRVAKLDTNADCSMKT